MGTSERLGTRLETSDYAINSSVMSSKVNYQDGCVVYRLKIVRLVYCYYVYFDMEQDPIDYIKFGAVPSEGENVTNCTNGTMIGSEPTSFIHSPYAYAISGVFVWSALFLTCFQVSALRERGLTG